jgi:hypothetical protein
MRLATASRHYGRNLVRDVENAGVLGTPARMDLEQGGRTLLRSLAVLASALTGSRDGTYTRSASFFDQAQRHLESSSTVSYADLLAIRDLMLIDQTMATMAELMALDVTDLDSTKVRLAGAVPSSLVVRD